jgi:hypothetical protein
MYQTNMDIERMDKEMRCFHKNDKYMIFLFTAASTSSILSRCFTSGCRRTIFQNSQCTSSEVTLLSFFETSISREEYILMSSKRQSTLFEGEPIYQLK